MRDPTFRRFEYLQFAIEEMRGAEHELCLSGVPEVVLDAGADMDLAGSPVDPAARWIELLGARYGVDAANMFPTLGTSGGVFIALAAATSLLRDATGTMPVVAIERPAYGVFETGARFLGAEVRHIERSRDDRYRLDPERVNATCESGAGVVCVTDLHNPSCVALTDDVRDALHEIATRHDAWIIVDEVYRDFMPGPVGTTFRPDSRVIATSSLTKCYGRGPTRAGWMFGRKDLIERASAVREITHGVDPLPAQRAAVLGLEHADELLKRGRRLAARARPTMDGWVASEARVSWVPPDAGITALLDIEGLSDSRTLATRLRDDLSVQVVPGCFFGAEGSIRVSFGMPPAKLQRALETLSLGIGALV